MNSTDAVGIFKIYSVQPRRPCFVTHPISAHLLICKSLIPPLPSGNTCSSIREESSLNPRLTKPLPEFIAIMDNLNLPYPAKFDKSVPANLVCGLF